MNKTEGSRSTLPPSLHQNTSTFSAKVEMHKRNIYNLNGTDAIENYIVTTLPILLQFLNSIFIVFLYQLTGKDLKGNLLFNFLLVILPYLAFVTVLNNFLNEIYLALVTVVILFTANCFIMSKGSRFSPALRISMHVSNGKVGMLCISRFRGLLFVCAAIFILSVDLSAIFPRRFAKTEKYGISPMDLGVGFFTLASGLVNSTKYNSSFKLVILGLIRLIIVKWSEYPEHKTEYGEHWNFFFTLAAVQIIANVFKFAFKSLKKSLFLLIILFLIQSCVHYYLNLEKWALSDDLPVHEKWVFRLVTENRQGLVSLIGYIILWQIGAIMKIVLSNQKLYMLLPVICAALPPVLLNLSILNVSRCAANWSYVLWTSGVFSWHILLLMVCDSIVNLLEDRANYVTDTHCPDVFTLVNKYGLAFFLLANLMTGVVNKIFSTHELLTVASFGLLTGYSTFTILILGLTNNYLSSN